jgi:hypothetical protein
MYIALLSYFKASNALAFYARCFNIDLSRGCVLILNFQIRGFMMSNKRINNYFFQASNDIDKSQVILGSNFDMSTTPVSSLKNHVVSVLYPVGHAARAIKNLLKVAEGCLLLVNALFSDPKASIPLVLKGIAKEIGSLVINCLNVAASLMNFATRTISTVFNLGYSSFNVTRIFDSLDNKKLDDNFMNIFSGMGLGFSDGDSTLDDIFDESFSM